MKNILIYLLTHRHLVVRMLTAWVISIVILFASWEISYAWLPDGFFRFLPGMAFSPIGCETASISEAMKVFGWNLALTGGLTIFASLFAVGRFPLGYLVPWFIFAVYGGLLGTNTFLCSNPLASTGANISILWRSAGVKEITGYLLISASFADLYLWRQISFWHTRVERVRGWKELHFSWDMITGLLVAVGLLAWGAFEEVFNLL